MAGQIKPLPITAVSLVDMGLSPGFSTSEPSPFECTRKSSRGWSESLALHVYMTLKKLQTPCFGQSQIWLL